MALETKVPPQPIYRIGRQPDAWQAPDWSRASRSDGTFGNRFDDPESYYRVLYASSQEVSCFIETLARFRPDLTLLAELKAIEGEDDFLPLGGVPPDWCANRVLGTASAEGNYAEVCGGEWITHLVVRMFIPPLLLAFANDLAIHGIDHQLLAVVVGSSLALTGRLATDNLLGSVDRRVKETLTVRTAAGRAQTDSSGLESLRRTEPMGGRQDLDPHFLFEVRISSLMIG